MEFLKKIKIKKYIIPLITLVGLVFLFVLIFKIFFPIFKIPSESMEPTIISGDYVISKTAKFHTIERGDVIIFRSESKELLIKRVIGIPGDTIEIKDNKVKVNDKDDYYYLLNDTQITKGEETYTVPKNCYFVLGDNRENSKDSRFMENPYISQDNVIAIGIYAVGPIGGFHFKLLF